MLSKNLEERQAEMKKRVEARKAERQLILKDRPKCISCKKRQARVATPTKAASPFCSRCSGIGLENQLRDTLPGVVTKPQYQVFSTLNGGSTIFAEKPTLEEALKVFNENSNRGLFGIRYPDGSWHKWETKKEEDEDAILEVEPEPEPETHREVLQDLTDKKVYARKQVASMLGISCNTISRWERKGKVPQPRRTIHNNQCLYTEENIQAIKEYKEREYIPPTDIMSQTGAAALPRVIKRTPKSNKRMERVVAGRVGSLGKFF